MKQLIEKVKLPVVNEFFLWFYNAVLTSCYSFPLNSKIFKTSDASGASKNLVT